MEDDRSTLPTPKRTPWNKGKLIGAKPPLLARHVWSIRTKLQIERRTRDLAMFNLAIDSKLRGCDVIAIRVEDIAPNGYALARATVRQRKTGRPVRFELTEQTRQAVDDYLKVTGKVAGGFLFTSRRRPSEAMTTRQYARLVAEWFAGIGLDLHVQHPLTASHEGNLDLPPHRQPACGPAIAWPHEVGKYGPVSRHRSR